MKDRVGYHGYYLSSPPVLPSDRTAFNFERSRPIMGAVQLMEPMSFYGPPSLSPIATIGRYQGFTERDNFTSNAPDAITRGHFHSVHAEMPHHVTADVTWMSDVNVGDQLVTQDREMSANILIDLLRESLSDDCRCLESDMEGRAQERCPPMYPDPRHQVTPTQYPVSSRNEILPKEHHPETTDRGSSLQLQSKDEERIRPLIIIEPRIMPRQVPLPPKEAARHSAENVGHRRTESIPLMSAQVKMEVSRRDEITETDRDAPRQVSSNNDKAHKCDVCAKGFRQHSALRVHARVHTGERPYPCSYCNTKFADYSTFVKHVRVHTGQKPYKCNICHKSFTQSGNMLRHRRRHESEA